MVTLHASLAAYIADERHRGAKHRLHALRWSGVRGVGRCIDHSKYLSWGRRAFELMARDSRFGLRVICSRFVALFIVGNVPVATGWAAMLRYSLTKVAISARVSARLISCQVRVELGMLTAFVELAVHLFLGKFKQIVGGYWRDRLLAVAHGVKPSAVQPGLAEPSDGVVLGV